MMLWIWMGLVALTASAWLTRPLWSRRLGAVLQRRQLNVSIYRNRVTEIEQEQQVGRLDEETARALRDEAAVRLLGDVDDTEPAQAGKAATEPDAGSAAASRSAWGLTLVLGLGIAALSGAAYWSAGSREIQRKIALSATDPAQAQALALDAQMAQVQAYLADNPDDPDAWLNLGQGYFMQGLYVEAADAFARANALTTQAPVADWLAVEGEARMFSEQPSSLLEALKLFERALAIDPTSVKANWYAGMLAYRAEQYPLALRYWLRLRGMPLPQDVHDALEHQLQIVAERAGVDLPEPPAATPEIRLQVNVSVDETLQAQLPSPAYLMVFARRPEGGPPLAIRKLPYSGEQEQAVTLDKSDAVIDGMDLGTAQTWQVTARISRSGEAQAQAGDLEGQVIVQQANASEPVLVKIDQRVP